MVEHGFPPDPVPGCFWDHWTKRPQSQAFEKSLLGQQERVTSENHVCQWDFQLSYRFQVLDNIARLRKISGQPEAWVLRAQVAQANWWMLKDRETEFGNSSNKRKDVDTAKSSLKTTCFFALQGVLPHVRYRGCHVRPKLSANNTTIHNVSQHLRTSGLVLFQNLKETCEDNSVSNSWGRACCSFQHPEAFGRDIWWCVAILLGLYRRLQRRLPFCALPSDARMNPRYHGAAAMLSDSFEVFAAVFQRIPK